VFSDVTEVGANPKGRFAITYPHSLESAIILPAIEQLCKEYKNIEPELIATDETIDLVENQLDASIHIGELPDSNYRALPIGSIREIFCSTAAYMNVNTTENSKINLATSPNFSSTQNLDDVIKELSGHQWISTSWQKSQMKLRDSYSNSTFEVELNKFARTNTLPAAIAMVMRNLGIALVPDIAAKPLIQSGKLIHIAKQLTGPEWPVYTVHAYQQEKPIHLTRFHQLIYRAFEDYRKA